MANVISWGRYGKFYITRWIVSVFIGSYLWIKAAENVLLCWQRGTCMATWCSWIRKYRCTTAGYIRRGVIEMRYQWGQTKPGKTYIRRIFHNMVAEEYIACEGISHCESRVQGLCKLGTPKTAAELQKFLLAVNWLRNNIPNNTALIKNNKKSLIHPQRRQVTVRTGILSMWF